MLFKQAHLTGIAAGRITRAFRKWTRPTVKEGGTLTCAVGVLAIDEVAAIDRAEVTEAHAQQAGFDSAAALWAELDKRKPAPLYRVTFRLVGEDPRVALRQDTAWTAGAVDEMRAWFARLDERSPDGPWTDKVLRTVAANEQVRAPTLADQIGMQTKLFKDRVRKLKGKGLTESLPIGYRISPRGRALMAKLGLEVASTPPPAAAVTDEDKAAVLALVERAGVVLQAAAGPVPTLTYEIAGAPFNTSWWGHQKAHEMLALIEHVADSPDTLGCRLYQGKKTYVHRRLWPHLLALSPRLPASQTEVVEEEHTARGRHRVVTTPLVDWVPGDVCQAAAEMSEEEALAGLGDWVARELCW